MAELLGHLLVLGRLFLGLSDGGLAVRRANRGVLLRRVARWCFPRLGLAGAEGPQRRVTIGAVRLSSLARSGRSARRRAGRGVQGGVPLPKNWGAEPRHSGQINPVAAFDSSTTALRGRRFHRHVPSRPVGLISDEVTCAAQTLALRKPGPRRPRRAVVHRAHCSVRVNSRRTPTVPRRRRLSQPWDWGRASAAASTGRCSAPRRPAWSVMVIVLSGG